LIAANIKWSRFLHCIIFNWQISRTGVDKDLAAITEWLPYVEKRRTPSIDWLDEAYLFKDLTGTSNRNLLVLMKTHQSHRPIRAITIAKQTLQLCCLLTVGFFLSACKQESNVATGGNQTGVYALATVNGNKVPCSISHEGTALQVRSGTFTIKADGTCGTKTVFVPPGGVERTQEVSATYTKADSKLTMKWQGAGTTTGTVEGNTFTMDNEGMVLVYRK
jgi:hypothetical protein